MDGWPINSLYFYRNRHLAEWRFRPCVLQGTQGQKLGVVQYAGRLNRDYEGKKEVIIYDYVDHHIPMFETMYHKRLRAYKQIGYQLCSDIFENLRQQSCWN